jgi:hypothetical protein
MKDRLENTAHHEAGHVVAAWAHGLTCESASIEGHEDGSAGRIVHPSEHGYEGSGGRRAQRQIARAHIIVAYAGHEAQLLFDPDAPDGATRDRDDAWALMRRFEVLPRDCNYVGDDSCVRYLNRLRGDARRLVRRHWPIVEAVARELLNRRTLDTADLKRIREQFPRLP